VNARLLVDTFHDATLVPTAATQRGVQGTYVYVVGEDQTVSVRPVKLGPAEGELTAAERGLTSGELVVVDGADKLRDGAKVQLGEQGDLAGKPEGTDSKPDSGQSQGGHRHRRAEQ